MRLRGIEIANFRKLVGPVAFDLPGDGLTVLVGDNEDGKSTVLAALRCVFFERHDVGGQTAKRLLPFGAAVQPEIAVRFEHDDVRYELRKTFCQKESASLSWPGGRLAGPAAEERLQELLRFEAPGARGSKAEQQGVHGLFWVEQGKAFADPAKPLGVTESGRRAIASALEGEVGQVLGGDRGRRLLARVRELYAGFFTDRTGRQRGALRDAAKQVEKLTEERAKAAAQAANYDAAVDQLDQLRARVARWRAEDALGAAARAREDAERKAGELERIERRALELQERLRLAAAQRTAAAAKWSARERAVSALTQAVDEAAREQARRERAQAALAPLAERLGEAQAAAQAAEDARRAAALRAVAAERRRARAQLALEHETLAQRLEQARATQRLRAAKLGEAEAVAVDDKRLAQFRKLDRAAAEAEAGLAAAATLVELAPAAGASALIGGRPATSDRLTLAERTRIELPGWGALVIAPGGADLAARAAAAEAARARLDAALASAGAADMAAAESAARRRAQALAEAEAAAKVLDAHAPEGVEALAARLAGLAAQLDAIPADREPAPEGSPIEPAEAERALEEARQALAAADSAHRSAQQEALLAEQAWSAAERRRGLLEKELTDGRALEPDEALQAALAAAAEAEQAAQAMAETTRRSLAEADPEGVRERLDAARAAEARLKAEIAADSLKARELEIELQTLGHGDLAERLQELDGRLAAARESFARLQREAEAVRVLHEALVAAEREAKERFLAPVRDRIAPYLRLLMPGAELVIDESGLEITALRRAGVDEPFETLSVGAREQLAVLTRLAFADLMVEKGHPAMVILDDALVNSDSERMERMRHILVRAARRFQILVLTCREEDYRGTGAQIVRLADCSSPASLARSA